jgi:hypothetical protein
MLIVCGLLAELSAIARVAERIPVPVGVNVTLIGQIAPGTSAGGHRFVSEKSPVPENLLNAMA